MIVHRYILRQVFWPVLTAFISLNLLFLIVQMLKVAELALGAGVGLGDLLLVTVLFLPGFAVLTIPISVLTGVLLGFGRLADDGELVALAGAGLSPGRLFLAPVLAGLLAGGVSVLVAGFVAPASATSLHRELVDMSKRNVAASLIPGRFFEEIPRVVLYPRHRGSHRRVFDGFLMYDQRHDRAGHLLAAQRVEIEPSQRGNFLKLRLFNGEVHAHGQRHDLYSVATFDRASIGIHIDALVQDRIRFLPETGRMKLAELSRASRDPELPRRDRARFASAWHRRFAFPAAALLFGLLGCALGASGRLKGRRRMLLASVSVVAVYYLLMRLGDAFVEGEWLDPASASWLPNFLVGALALWLMVRRARRVG